MCTAGNQSVGRSVEEEDMERGGRDGQVHKVLFFERGGRGLCAKRFHWPVDA